MLLNSKDLFKLSSFYAFLRTRQWIDEPVEENEE
jgi:hypothetical protein